MSKKAICILFLILGWISFCNSNNIDTVYYDKNWKVTTSKRYKYYRVLKQERSSIKVADYYRSGKIQMTGGLKKIDPEQWTGPIFYFDRKGQVTSFELYESSLYPEFQSNIINQNLNIAKNDSLTLYGYYYKNGKLSSLGYGQDNCFRQGTWWFFYKDGNLKAKENYLNNLLQGEYSYYYENGSILYKGSFKDNKEDGATEYYSNDGKLKKTIFYSNGEIIKKVR